MAQSQGQSWHAAQRRTCVFSWNGFDLHFMGSVDCRMCPAIILTLSPLGTQTWIEEQDSEERGELNVSGLCNRLIWSQKYKTKSTWCGPLPRSNKILATLFLSIQEGNF